MPGRGGGRGGLGPAPQIRCCVVSLMVLAKINIEFLFISLMNVC